MPKQTKLELTLSVQIEQAKLPAPERELMFAPGRRWRFDFAWPEKALAAEIEGGTWVKGAHSRGKHFESDAEKYNAAVLSNWRVLRFTCDMVNDGRALATIKKALEA